MPSTGKQMQGKAQTALAASWMLPACCLRPLVPVVSRADAHVWQHMVKIPDAGRMKLLERAVDD